MPVAPMAITHQGRPNSRPFAANASASQRSRCASAERASPLFARMELPLRNALQGMLTAFAAVPPPFEPDSLVTFGSDGSLDPSFGVEQEAARKATVSEAARRRGCSRAIVSRSVRNQNASGPDGSGTVFRDEDK